MPVAVIQNATRSDQRSIVTTLQALARDIHASGIGSPAIMVVGETVRYAQSESVTALVSAGAVCAIASGGRASRTRSH